mmetsp:Transcript_37618/g.108595  ORF Transcript_37618/g.108595 Transcript_37618/m.108595 type:complete len:399 (-) Transcript_37618:99-1295(-)
MGADARHGAALPECAKENLPPVLDHEVDIVIPDATSYTCGQTVRSESKVVGNFRFRLLVFPAGSLSTQGEHVSAFVEADPRDELDGRWVFRGVKYQISVINWLNYQNSVVKAGRWTFSKDGIDRGWHETVATSDLCQENGWLGPDNSLHIRARCDVRQAVRSKGMAVPRYWSKQSDDVEFVDCPHLVRQVQDYFNSFHAPWSRDRRDRAGQAKGVPQGYDVQCVTRIQNKPLYARFIQARDAVGALARGAGFGPHVPPRTADLRLEVHGGLDASSGECYLFHGSEFVEDISRSGFDITRANAASLLGAKIYFSEIAGKSDEYTGRQQRGLTMLLCRVVLGNCFYTEEQNPNKLHIDRHLGHGFHSARSFRKSTTQLTEFAISQVAQAYPEYKITYSRR